MPKFEAALGNVVQRFYKKRFLVFPLYYLGSEGVYIILGARKGDWQYCHKTHKQKITWEKQLV